MSVKIAVCSVTGRSKCCIHYSCLHSLMDAH